jgi:hypothetical protein
MVWLDHCRVGEPFPGEDFIGEAGLTMVVVLRIVEGVWIVLLRIELGGMGLFGDLVDKGSGLCIIYVVSVSSCSRLTVQFRLKILASCKQWTNT